MGMILDGKAIAASMNEALQAEAATLLASGIVPCLAIVRVGERPDDLAYERGAMKRCETVGVDTPAECVPFRVLYPILSAYAVSFDAMIRCEIVYSPAVRLDLSTSITAKQLPSSAWMPASRAMRLNRPWQGGQKLPLMWSRSSVFS